MVVGTGLKNARVPVLGFVAPSGTGKTTLLSRLLGLLSARGLRVGVVKQARDDFDVDVPGKDSYELRKAGVERLLLVSEQQSALLLEHPGGNDPQLDDLLPLFDQSCLDLILTEGFSRQQFPKIELYREGNDYPRYPRDPWVIALATDRIGGVPASVPELDINNPAMVADFVLDYLEEQRQRG